MIIPDGIKLYADEHGGEWELAVKSYKDEGETFGYADGTRGRVPESTSLVVEYAPGAPVAEFVGELRERNYRFLTVRPAKGAEE